MDNEDGGKIEKKLPAALAASVEYSRDQSACFRWCSDARATSASGEQLEGVWGSHPRVRSRRGRRRWEISCRGAVRLRSRVRLFLSRRSHDGGSRYRTSAGDARWRARRVFSRAPRARPDLSVSTRDYSRARLSILALTTSSHPAQEACSRTRLSRFCEPSGSSCRPAR